MAGSQFTAPPPVSRDRLIVHLVGQHLSTAQQSVQNDLNFVLCDHKGLMLLMIFILFLLLMQSQLREGYLLIIAGSETKKTKL